MENIENQLQFPHELQLLHKTLLKQPPNQTDWKSNKNPGP